MGEGTSGQGERVRSTRGEISSGDKLASWHVGEGRGKILKEACKGEGLGYILIYSYEKSYTGSFDEFFGWLLYGP